MTETNPNVLSAIADCKTWLNSLHDDPSPENAQSIYRQNVTLDALIGNIDGHRSDTDEWIKLKELSHRVFAVINPILWPKTATGDGR